MTCANTGDQISATLPASNRIPCNGSAIAKYESIQEHHAIFQQTSIYSAQVE